MAKIGEFIKLYFGPPIPDLWRFSRKAAGERTSLGRVLPPHHPLASYAADFSGLKPKDVRMILRRAVRLNKIDPSILQGQPVEPRGFLPVNQEILRKIEDGINFPDIRERIHGMYLDIYISFNSLLRELWQVGFDNEEAILFIGYVLKEFVRRKGRLSGEIRREIFWSGYLKSYVEGLRKLGFSEKEAVSLLLRKANADRDTPDANRLLFNDIKNRLGVGEKLFRVAKILGLLKELAFLLNDKDIPYEVKDLIVELAKEEVDEVWGERLIGQPQERLVEAFRYCADVMAEKAIFTYEKIKEITTRSKKPTFTVYILSTAYKLCIERFSDIFREQGLSKEEVKQRMREFSREVAEKRKTGKSVLEARMETGKEWLEKGLIARFSLPVFIKVNTMAGSVPGPSQRMLGQILPIAGANNYDIIFIDRSTFREEGMGVSLRNVLNFVKGKGFSWRQYEGTFVIKDGHEIVLSLHNNWEVSNLQTDRPNLIAFNLHDDREAIYYLPEGLSHHWTVEEPGPGIWHQFPVEDRPEFVGIYWDNSGKICYYDWLVLMRESSGEYRATSSIKLFRRFFKLAIERLRQKI